ncbi:hypothetical protein DH2020_043126 [Rehmannia glutinosa]|uniref:C3H1-type domain-containing protein n=1 Tax=Rehmannia glutinosa TaxID=99300 RepID=A0ABR0ULU8_REHGL
MEAEKSSFCATGTLEEFSDKSHRGQESATISSALQSKIPSRISDANIGIEGAKSHKQDMKSNPTKLNVDEFGRLVREGVSDSDTNDSPDYTRRHARRARNRSSSQSRSRSPVIGGEGEVHGGEKRGGADLAENFTSSVVIFQLVSKKTKSRSRSPGLKRDSEFSGEKRRRDKGQLPECFDFRRGKCYRGANCRYSHHETDKSERLSYNRGKQQYRDAPPSLRSPDVHEEGKVFYHKEVDDKGLRLPQDMPGSSKVRDAKELPVDSTTHSPDKLNSPESGSILVADVVVSNLSGYSAHDMPSGKENSSFPKSPAQYSDETPQIVDQQGKRIDDSLISESSSFVQASAATSAHLPADRPDAKQSPNIQPYSSEEVQSQSLKEFPPSVANHPPQFTLPLASVSQVMSAPFAQPITQDYNVMPPSAWFHSAPENHSPYQAPVAYQRSYFPVSSNSLSSPFLPPPPPPPPHPHLSVNVTTGEHSHPSQHTQQSLQPPLDGLSSYTSMREQPTELPNRSQPGQYQVYPFAPEHDRRLNITNNFGSSSLHVSNLTSLQSDSHIIGERVTGHPGQGMNPLPSSAQTQPYSLLMKSPSKATHSSIGGGLPSDSNSSHGHTYFQQASYNLHYSAAGGVPAQFSQPGKVSSSMSRITPDFLERNRPSYVHKFVGSRISNHFNPYASTFDLPLSSKFNSNASIQENDTTINTSYGAPIGLSTVPWMRTTLEISGLPAESILPRPDGDQYDPLFDSMEPASTSFSRADHKNHVTPGDSDNMPRFSGSGRVLNIEGIKQEGETAVSANDSIENEEFGRQLTLR